MIIYLSVILHYVHYFHPNSKKFVKIQGHVWLRIMNICQKYTFIINIMAWLLFKKTQVYQPKWSKQKVSEKANCIYDNYKIQSCHMGIIFTQNHMTWKRQKYVIHHSMFMCYHTGNVYWYVVPNFLVLISLTRKQMISIPTPFLKFVFEFIIWLHVVQNMTDFCYLTRKVFNCQHDTASVQSTKYTLEKS